MSASLPRLAGARNAACASHPQGNGVHEPIGEATALTKRVGCEPSRVRELADIAIELASSPPDSVDLADEAYHLLAQSLTLRNVLVDLCLHTQRAMSTLEQRLESIGRTQFVRRTEPL